MLNVVSSPRKAVILAAGFGTRLLPLTRVVPKPLLPLWGVPMLDRALAMVKSWGVRDVLVNVHHSAHAIVTHLVHRAPDGLRIQISFEPEILGTGGALVKAAWFFSDGKPFWLVNADVVASVDSRPILRAFRPGKTIASAWVMATRGPRTVECKKGFITNFTSTQPGTEGTFTFCGVHLVDPAVLNYLPASGFASVIKAYQTAMTGKWKIAAVPIEKAYWADIGTPDQYLEAHRELAGEGVGAPVQDPGSVRVSISNRMIYGPGIAAQSFSGIMALRAVDALDGSERAIVDAWSGDLGRVIACPLAPRGSSRNFTRLYHNRDTAMLVRHKPEREENNLYVPHTRFLSALGIPVPRVLAEDAAHHLALFEDVGTTGVQDEAPRMSRARLESLYQRVLEVMLVFHEKGYQAARKQKIQLMPPFDNKLYQWEHDLFTGLFLRDFMGVKEKKLALVNRDLKKVALRLSRLRPVLVHRDLQSSNIILQGEAWRLIDFQGMRFGPAVYDLASLLCDPYINIEPSVRERLLIYYNEKADVKSRSLDLFWCGVIQRLGQALGAYARLGKLPGTAHFLRYIQPGLRNMLEALEQVKGLPALQDTVQQCLDKTRT